MSEAIEQKVRELLSAEKTMHDWEHTFRVYNNAMRLCAEEQADAQIVALSALLHECDDYKIFGQENAENLTNTRRILAECKVEPEIAEEVIDIVSNIGYSKYLSGTQKLNKNGRIVQDADMLDSMGIIGVVRAIVFNARASTGKTFVKEMFPRENLSKEEYQNKMRTEETAINHMFEKLLKLKDLMYTQSGKLEGKRRHQAMVDFLEEFFREQGLDNWLAYLHRVK